jgi:branched-subunit amino acid transport protein
MLDENGKHSATRLLVFTFAFLLVAVAIGDVFFDKDVGEQPYAILQAILMVIVAAITTRSAVQTVVNNKGGSV